MTAGFAQDAGAQAGAFFPADAARGRSLAVACMACHGSAEMLSPTEPAFHVPKLAGQRGEAIFSALQDYRSGARQSAVMQPFVAALSIQDMRDVAAYLAASGPYVPGTEDAGSSAHRKVRDDCTACHGESGMGVMAGVPVLTGQHEDYLIHALEAYRDGSRTNPTMGPIAQALAPDEVVQLAAYFAKQSHLEPNAMPVPAAANAAPAGPAPAVDNRVDPAGSPASAPADSDASGAAASESAGESVPPENSASPADAAASALTDAASVAGVIGMIDVPAGEFVMGTAPDAGFQNGTPPHDVSVPAFRLAATEVTFDQYDAFARATGRDLPPDEGWGRGTRPVIHVTWRDVHAFIDWLNAGTGRQFRLPTEAEWEYAARARAATLYPWGDAVDHTLVNNSVDAGADQWAFTAPVAQFPPNVFGLYDMLGNVWEFVQDCRHPTYDGAPADGSAWIDGSCDSRIVRGGSWGSTSRGVQPAARGAASEFFDAMDLGFRLAEEISSDQSARD